MRETPPALLTDTAESRCRFYRQVCGLAAGIKPETGRISVQAGSVGAITMPARLGQSVKARMQTRKCVVGPIVSHPRSQRWTFLIRPDLPDEVRLFSELFRLNVTVARLGAEIALPSPARIDAAFRVWVEPPRDTVWPSGMVVVEAIRACVDARPSGPN